jgi:hypothetical protein
VEVILEYAQYVLEIDESYVMIRLLMVMLCPLSDAAATKTIYVRLEFCRHI